MREILSAIKTGPHPEPVEGRMATMQSTLVALPRATASLKPPPPRGRGEGPESVLGGLDFLQEAVDGGVVEVADGFGQAVGELGRLGGEAGGVDDDAGMR